MRRLRNTWRRASNSASKRCSSSETSAREYSAGENSAVLTVATAGAGEDVVAVGASAGAVTVGAVTAAVAKLAAVCWPWRSEAVRVLAT